MNMVNNMALVYYSQGRYEEALELNEGAVTEYEKALGKEHPSTMDTINNTVIVYGE